MAAVTRAQLPEPPAMQPRGPSTLRTQTATPVAMRPRSSAPSPIYRMRGIVSGAHVYWLAFKDDTLGEQYVGATPTDIVCVGPLLKIY